MKRIEFTYGEFYDVPRMIEFQHGGQWFFLRSFFDEEKDDYNDFYDVYLLPFQTEDDVKACPDYWKDLASAFHLGRIPTNAVGLDETRRRSLDAVALDDWLAACGKQIRVSGAGATP